MSIFNRVKSSNINRNVDFNNDNFILGKDESLLPKFTKIFGINYSVNIYYLKIQKPELYLQKDCVNIHLPMNYRNKNNQKLLNVILLNSRK